MSWLKTSRLVGRRNRPLRIEGLETRWMLAADWPGFMVGDLNGNLLAVDVEGTGHADRLAAMTMAMFDIAATSTGIVHGIGGPAEGPSILYEIPVDYQNPGGLIAPVEIGWLYSATTFDSLWINGLSYAPDGTLLAVGFDELGDNYLFSVSPGNASATELVWLGPHRPAGDLALDEEGTIYTVTFGGNLLAIPSDYSGYTVVGNVGFSDVYGLTYGPGPDLYGYLSDGRILEIDTADATWEQVNWIWSSTVPSLSSILGAATVFEPPTDLGEVDYVTLTDQAPILETLWYRLDAAHDGYLTVELDDLGTTTGLEMALYRVDSAGELVWIDGGTTRVDHLAAEHGDRYFVEITGLRSDATVRVVNQVTPGANSLLIHGSDESDTLELAVGETWSVDINGVHYDIEFSGSGVVTTTFGGAAGGDSARIVGGRGDDVALFDLATQTGEVSGPGYEIALGSVAVMEFDGGRGDDTAQLLGANADGQIVLAPFTAAITEGLLRAAVENVEQIAVDAAGGADHVVFEGRSGADSVTLYPDSGVFEDKDKTDYRITTANVETNEVRGGGGSDVAYLRDSIGDEYFKASLSRVEYSGPGYSHELRGFGEVHAYGLNGGNDRALIYDTTYDDKFKGREDQSVLRALGGGYYFRAKGFEDVVCKALNGGDNLAVFDDTAGNDTFTASYESARLTNGTIAYQAEGFEHVLARSTGAYDVAHLQDSPGDDELRARSHKSTFQSAQMDLTVRGFDEVHAEAVFGGNDIAKLHDTAGNNHLTASGNIARMWQNDGVLDLLYEAIAFERVNAYWSTGTNTKDITLPIDFIFREIYL